MAAETETHLKRSRTRSPAYPYIPLPAALEKAAVLWQVEGRHPAAVNVAMQHWGYKEDSSTGYSCVAALKKFGLVDHDGMGESRQVRLSGLALSILLDKNPDSPARRDALRAAALGPRIHAELWERYGTELPSDQSLKRFLVVERSFNEAAVDELLDEYKVTMAFAGLPVGAGASGMTGLGAEAAARQPMAVLAALPPAAGAAAASNRTAAGAELTGAPNEQGRHGQEARQEPLRTAPRPSGRPPAGSNAASDAPMVSGAVPRAAVPAPARGAAAQRHLFGDGEEDEAATGPGVYEETLPPVSRTRSDAAREGSGPWSMARKELPVPLDNDSGGPGAVSDDRGRFPAAHRHAPALEETAGAAEPLRRFSWRAPDTAAVGLHGVCRAGRAGFL